MNWHLDQVTCPFFINYFSQETLTLLMKRFQELYDLGGRNVAVLGLPPLGCLPSQITLHGKGNPGCVEEYNARSFIFNKVFIDLINNELKPNFHGGRLIYIDDYTIFEKILSNPGSYGTQS